MAIWRKKSSEKQDDNQLRDLENEEMCEKNVSLNES